MVESLKVWNCTELIIVLGIKIHNFEHTIEEYHCKSIFESPYKIETVFQEYGPKADCFVLLELDKTHVLLNTDWYKVAILDRLLVNSFNRDNFFTMIRYPGVNMVHVVDGKEDDAAFITAHSEEFHLLEFLL